MIEAKTISKVQEAQTALKAAIEELYLGVKTEVDNIPSLNGVKPISDTSICGCIVSFTAMFSSPGCILSPDYYIPQVQADAVLNTLTTPSMSLETFMRRLEKMVQTGKVEGKGHDVMLNPNTLKVLRDIQAQFQQ